jgi:hypothetical protein
MHRRATPGQITVTAEQWDRVFGPKSEPDECLSCGEGCPRGECKDSPLECGPHCNCIWIHDVCHNCGAAINDEGDLVLPEHRYPASPAAKAHVHVGRQVSPVRFVCRCGDEQYEPTLRAMPRSSHNRRS